MISSLEYGAFLAYSPHGTSERSKQSRVVRDLIKNDRSAGSPPRNAIDHAIERMRTDPGAADLRAMFSPDVVLVPCPGSHPLPPVAGPARWTPRRICQALVAAGFGASVFECLRRATPIAKSAFAGRGNRPSPQQHYDSIGVTELPLVAATRIVLVDDFVTKGATLLGAASHLVELFPDASVSSFALVRTMGLVANIDRIVDPVTGTIRLLDGGEADRQP